MDYSKIGNFIAAERKAKNLTQAKLAQELFVSEKTVSKWENGKGIPDTTVLPKLCDIFKVSVNELLNGQRISQNDYQAKAEEKLIELQTEKQACDKRLLRCEIALGVITTLSFVIILLISMYAFNLGMTTLPIILLVLGIAIFITGTTFCLYIEQKAGYYECSKCGHKHIPTFAQICFAPHINRTRHLKCPHCQQRSWNKKVVK